MSLATQLRSSGIEWCIDLIYVDEPSQRYPGTIYKIPHTRIRLADLAAASATGTEPVTLECLLRSDDASRENDKYLAYAMRKHLPAHPAFKTWLRSRGHVPVTIQAERLEGSLGYCIHVALRKACDGPQSSILWNAVNHLLPEDWSHILRLIREAVTLAMKKVADSKKATLTYYGVGVAIEYAMANRMDEVRYRDFEATRGEVARTELQRFALMSFSQAARLTDQQEFIWGWTAYLVEESKKQEAPREAQAA